MARRVNYIKAFKAKFGGVPTLLVDSGNLFAEQRTKHGDTRLDGVMKNESLLKAYDQFRVDVANLAASDMDYLAPLLQSSAFAKRSEAQPIFKRLVSANLVAEAPDAVKLPAFLLREVPLAHSAKAVRVAFVGIADASSPMMATGVKIADPIETAKRVLPEARRNADVVIVLARVRTDMAARLAKEVPGINVIIAGNGEMFMPSFKIGDTLITFTPFESRFVGELRFYQAAPGGYTFRDRFISLDEGVSDDPGAVQMTKEAKEAKENAYKNAQKLLTDWLGNASVLSDWKSIVAQAKPGAAPEYISSGACAQCHTDQYVKWANSQHARASDVLSAHKDDFEEGCMQCHATGSRPGALPKLATVQCEQCHGAGSQHAAKPAQGYGKISDMKAACASCHTPQTSPNFDYQAAWLRMKH
ncbi:MAG: hypothetical protein HY231_26770 [Acidobacteria bacterium]|nr:hypothetical protein [Acidobacteriota bacterium]